MVGFSAPTGFCIGVHLTVGDLAARAQSAGVGQSFQPAHLPVEALSACVHSGSVRTAGGRKSGGLGERNLRCDHGWFRCSGVVRKLLQPAHCRRYVAGIVARGVVQRRLEPTYRPCSMAGLHSKGDRSERHQPAVNGTEVYEW